MLSYFIQSGNAGKSNSLFLLIVFFKGPSPPDSIAITNFAANRFSLTWTILEGKPVPPEMKETQIRYFKSNSPNEGSIKQVDHPGNSAIIDDLSPDTDYKMIFTLRTTDPTTFSDEALICPRTGEHKLVEILLVK